MFLGWRAPLSIGRYLIASHKTIAVASVNMGLIFLNAARHLEIVGCWYWFNV